MQPLDSNSLQLPLVPIPPKPPLYTLKAAVFLVVLVVFLIPLASFMPLLAGMLLGWDFIEATGILEENLGSFVLLTQSIGLVITIVLIRNRLKKLELPWSAIGLKKFRFVQAMRYIGGFYLIMLGLAAIVAVIAAGLGIDPSTASINVTGKTDTIELIESMGGFWATFVLTVIFAPIIEEILFRGVLFPAIKYRYGVIAGILISGLLFAMAHLNPLQILALIPMGVYLAIMYQRTKSIYPGIILHASWNLMVVLIAESGMAG